MRRRLLGKKDDYYNGYDYVDLGLPSGLLWATKNIGASSEEQNGLYFQWGDIQGYTTEQVSGSATPHKNFSWADYKYCTNAGKKTSAITKYNSSDGLMALDVSDDAARANMGGSWRMPTSGECKELFNNCNWSNTIINSVSGLKVVNKKDKKKYIFLPLAGNCTNGGVSSIGSYGTYWTSTNSTSVNEAWYLNFMITSWSVMDSYRYIGAPIRGVIEPN